MRYLEKQRTCVLLVMALFLFLLCTQVVCACPPVNTEPLITDEDKISKVITIYDSTTGEVKTIYIPDGDT